MYCVVRGSPEKPRAFPDWAANRQFAQGPSGSLGHWVSAVTGVIVIG